MSRFLSGALRQLAPYVPGEQPHQRRYIKLNTNESPYPPAPGVLRAVGVEAADLRLYPDPEARELKAALAARHHVGPENIFVGNGSDEVLNFAFLAFASDGRGAAFADITYGFYPVFCSLYHIPTRFVPLRENFTLNPEDYYGLGRTIVLANPNAPTGLALSRAQVEEIVKANQDSVVIVDEAYVDFGGESCVELTRRHGNLLVVQTFSKSRSLAGARLGFAVGNRELIADLETIKFSTNPYNVNRLTLRAGAEALAEQRYYDKCCQAIMETRDRTAEQLRGMGFTVLPSRTNFLFVRREGLDGAAIYRGLKDRGVLVRHFDQARIQNFVRVTVGTPEQMNVFLEKLRELL